MAVADFLSTSDYDHPVSYHKVEMQASIFLLPNSKC